MGRRGGPGRAAAPSLAPPNPSRLPTLPIDNTRANLARGRPTSGRSWKHCARRRALASPARLAARPPAPWAPPWPPPGRRWRNFWPARTCGWRLRACCPSSSARPRPTARSGPPTAPCSRPCPRREGGRGAEGRVRGWARGWVGMWEVEGVRGGRQAPFCPSLALPSPPAHPRPPHPPLLLSGPGGPGPPHPGRRCGVAPGGGPRAHAGRIQSATAGESILSLSLLAAGRAVRRPPCAGGKGVCCMGCGAVPAANCVACGSTAGGWAVDGRRRAAPRPPPPTPTTTTAHLNCSASGSWRPWPACLILRTSPCSTCTSLLGGGGRVRS